jgi:hypothetical protein
VYEPGQLVGGCGAEIPVARPPNRFGLVA